MSTVSLFFLFVVMGYLGGEGGGGGEGVCEGGDSDKEGLLFLVKFLVASLLEIKQLLL
jgi:hypothetical protein